MSNTCSEGSRQDGPPGRTDPSNAVGKNNGLSIEKHKAVLRISAALPRKRARLHRAAALLVPGST